MKKVITLTIMFFLTGSAGDKKAELNAHMENDVGVWAAICAIIIPLVLVTSLSFLQKVDLKKFFKDIPNKTSHTFTHFFVWTPTYMLLVVFIIILLDVIFELSEAINLLPLILMQLPAFRHALEMSKMEDALEEDEENNLNYHGLDEKLINKERAALNSLSLWSAVGAYILIFMLKISWDSISEKYSSQDQTLTASLFLVSCLIFLIIISVFTYFYQRYFIYVKYLNN